MNQARHGFQALTLGAQTVQALRLVEHLSPTCRQVLRLNLLITERRRYPSDGRVEGRTPDRKLLQRLENLASFSVTVSANGRGEAFADHVALQPADDRAGVDAVGKHCSNKLEPAWGFFRHRCQPDDEFAKAHHVTRHRCPVAIERTEVASPGGA